MAGFQVEDGRGKGYRAQVTKDLQLAVEATARQRLAYISADRGLAFSVTSHDATAAAGTFILYLKNTATTRDLVVSSVRVGAVETVLWKLWFVTGTAAGGNALTPTNNNKMSGNVAEATCRGDDSITGLSTDGQIGAIRTAATNHGLIDLEQSVILGTNDAIAVEYDTGTTGIAEAFCRFYYEAR